MAEFDRYQIYSLLNQSRPLWLGAVDLRECFLNHSVTNFSMRRMLAM
jgi:hypothetical protein